MATILLFKGSHKISRGYSSSHKGYDVVTAVGTKAYAPLPYKLISRVQKYGCTQNWKNTGTLTTRDYGNFIKIGVGGSWEILIAHLCGSASQGTGVVNYPFASTGNSGNSTGAHAHCEFRYKGTPTTFPNFQKYYNTKSGGLDVFTDNSGIFKDKTGKPVTLSAERWHASAVRYIKDYRATNAKLMTALAQIAELKKKVGTIEADLKEVNNSYELVKKDFLAKTGMLAQLLEESHQVDDALGLEPNSDQKTRLQAIERLKGLIYTDSEPIEPAPSVWDIIVNLFKRR